MERRKKENKYILFFFNCRCSKPKYFSLKQNLHNAKQAELTVMVGLQLA